MIFKIYTITEKICKRKKVASEQIFQVEGFSMMHRNNAAIWFKQFNGSITSLLNKPPLRRPSIFDDDLLCKALQIQLDQVVENCRQNFPFLNQ